MTRVADPSERRRVDAERRRKEQASKASVRRRRPTSARQVVTPNAEQQDDVAGPAAATLLHLAKELARIEGQLANDHFDNPWAWGAAKVLEGVRACLMTPKFIERGRAAGKSRGVVLAEAAAMLVKEARVSSAYSRGRLPATMLRLVERILTGEAERGRKAAPAILSAGVELAIQQCPEDEGCFSSLGHGDARISELLPVVAGVLRLHEIGSWGQKEGKPLSEKIVVACAKRAGHRRPSAFLDRERKRTDRKLGQDLRTD